MKKNFRFALVGAIALTGAVGISSCSSSDDVSDVNPAFDGEAVKTQFSISLPFNNANNATTRQGYDVVQEGAVIGSTTNIAKFRGMSNIVLIPYSNATDRTTRLGDNITLGADKLLRPAVSNAANAIPNGQLLTNSTAVLYNDVTIPIGTAGFLFYGEATASADNKFTYGSLTPAPVGLTGESSGITFSPTPILGSSGPTTTKGEALAAYVSSIAAASYDTDGTANDVEFIWAKCANSNNSNEAWYNAALGEMYTAFTSMKPGASSYVQAAVQDLYTSILNNTDKVSLAIKSAITNGTYVSSSTGGTLTFVSDITGYPADAPNYMPEGAAALEWSSQPISSEDATADPDKPKIATAVAGSNYGYSEPLTTNTTNVIDMTKIVYPASLYYYVNSSIKVSNTSRIDDYNKEGAASENYSWANILGKYQDGTAVSSATRSVAVFAPIQYAVGRLDVTVNNLNQSKYYDRKGEEVTIPAGGFQLTGVLIGGQKVVDYKFEQSSSDEYTIYDKTINTENASSTSGVSQYVTASVNAGPTYTLALETAEDQTVFVALEFVNSTDDFQGYDGVVKKGCKFYMIAQLNPSSNVDGKVSGVTNTGKKVFKQDFKTIANFTFAAGSTDGNGDGVADNPGGFAKAYTTIPDLRTPELELGLSVDLKWQEGITFTVVF